MIRTLGIALCVALLLYGGASLVVAVFHPFDWGYSASARNLPVDVPDSHGGRDQVVVVEDHSSDWLLWWMFWSPGFSGGCYNCGYYGYHYTGGGYYGPSGVYHTTVNNTTVINKNKTTSINKPKPPDTNSKRAQPPSKPEKPAGEIKRGNTSKPAQPRKPSAPSRRK